MFIIADQIATITARWEHLARAGRLLTYKGRSYLDGERLSPAMVYGELWSIDQSTYHALIALFDAAEEGMDLPPRYAR